MTDAVKVGFVPFSAAPRGVLVGVCDDTLKFGPATTKALGATANAVKRAASANQFKGKSGAALDILAPEGLKTGRLIVIGAGKLASLKDGDFIKFGGKVAAKISAGTEAVTILAELPSGAMKGSQAAAIGIGRPSARLSIRPLQDQEEGRRQRAAARTILGRGGRRRRRAQGLRA